MALVKPYLAKLSPVLHLSAQEERGETAKSPKDGYKDAQYLEFQQGGVKRAGTVWCNAETIKQ